MGSTHFLTRKLVGVSAEVSLNVLAYSMKRVMNIIGTAAEGDGTSVMLITAIVMASERLVDSFKMRKRFYTLWARNRRSCKVAIGQNSQTPPDGGRR